MLKKLRLTNFKAFGDPGLEIETGLITVLIGPNGTGKSSVLQALLLLKQQEFKAEGLRSQGTFANLGDYRHLVHDHDTFLSMEIELGIALDIPLPAGGMQEQFYYLADFVHLDAVGHGFMEFHNPQQFEESWANSRRTAFRDALGESAPGPARALLRNFLFIPTMRGFVQLRYDPEGQMPEDMPHLNYPDGWGRATASLLAYRKDILRSVSPLVWRIISGGDQTAAKDWLRLGLDPYNSKLMLTPESETESPLVHEGFGSNQLVVLLTWLSFAIDGALVGIEEPEIHLHPKAQSELARVLAEAAKEQRKQLIITTHSEHILTSLLTQVAASALNPEELAVYSFSRNDKTGKTQAERLEITENGAVKGGLRDFFEVERQEVDRYISALSQRRQ